MAEEKEKKGFLKEFKEFATRGNVMDMAVGVIIATAFGKITTSLVNDVFMPFVGWLIGDIDLSQLDIVLRQAVMEGEEIVTPAVTIGIGAFISTIIDFILIALVVFLMIKAINTAHERAEARKKAAEPEPEPEPEAPPAPTTEELLTEILAELKKK
jgi:large conductance mechanosensitive channel